MYHFCPADFDLFAPLTAVHVMHATAQQVRSFWLAFWYGLHQALFHNDLNLYDHTAIVPRPYPARFTGHSTSLHNGSRSCITAVAVLLNTLQGLPLQGLLQGLPQISIRICILHVHIVALCTEKQRSDCVTTNGLVELFVMARALMKGARGDPRSVSGMCCIPLI